MNAESIVGVFGKMSPHWHFRMIFVGYLLAANRNLWLLRRLRGFRGLRLATGCEVDAPLFCTEPFPAAL
jgi:hypothetical protein